MTDQILLCGLLLVNLLPCIDEAEMTRGTHHFTWSANVSTLFPPRYVQILYSSRLYSIIIITSMVKIVKFGQNCKVLVYNSVVSHS